MDQGKKQVFQGWESGHVQSVDFQDVEVMVPPCCKTSVWHLQDGSSAWLGTDGELRRRI